MTRPARESILPLDLPSGPDFSAEAAALREGARRVCGIDEAGRGPLAGPVVAAAVILDPENIPQGLDDSKKLSETEREALAEEIWRTAHVAVVAASAERIDRTDILRATLWAMARAVRALPVESDHALIDGRDVPPGLACPGRALIKGDGRSVSIAAASIVAKTSRDAMMIDLAAACPGYGFERHKGYGSKLHREAILRLGPSPYHRLSFAPMRAMIGR